MSSQIEIYTFKAMEKAYIDANTNFSTVYPAINCNDFNPRIYAQVNDYALASQLSFDLSQSGTDREGLFIWLNNYKSIITGSSQPYVNVEYYDAGWQTVYLYSLYDITTPIRLLAFPAGTNKQRYRLSFTTTAASGVPLKIGMICLYKKRTLARGYQRPDQSGHRFYNQQVNVETGQSYPVISRRQKTEFYPRTYALLGTTQRDILRDAHADCFGSAYPLVINEGSLISDARLVRFKSDEFVPNGVDADYFKPSVEFLQVPWVDDGESY